MSIKDNLNNSLSIFINPANLKSYIANTKEFPYYDRFIKEIISEVLLPVLRKLCVISVNNFSIV